MYPNFDALGAAFGGAPGRFAPRGKGMVRGSFPKSPNLGSCWSLCKCEKCDSLGLVSSCGRSWGQGETLARARFTPRARVRGSAVPSLFISEFGPASHSIYLYGWLWISWCSFVLNYPSECIGASRENSQSLSFGPSREGLVRTRWLLGFAGFLTGGSARGRPYIFWA